MKLYRKIELGFSHVKNRCNQSHLLRIPYVSKIIKIKKSYSLTELINCWNRIKIDGVENGKYMIKEREIRYNNLAYFTVNKTYFCHMNSGICFTSKRKNGDIFYLNNFNKILKLAKHLASNNDSMNRLISIVDRSTGNEIFIFNKLQSKSSISVYIKN